MGIRRAIQGDVARIMEIRHSVRENRLSDPNLLTGKDCAEFIERSEIWVWEEDGIVQAFAAGDIRDGWIWALFVAPEYEGRGIGKALLSMACETLRMRGIPLRISVPLRVRAPNGFTRKMAGCWSATTDEARYCLISSFDGTGLLAPFDRCDQWTLIYSWSQQSFI